MTKEKSGDEEELDDLPPLEGDEEKNYSVPSTPLSKVLRKKKD